MCSRPDCGADRDDEAGDAGVAALDGLVERGAAVGVLERRVCRMVQERLDNLAVSTDGRPVHRRRLDRACLRKSRRS